MGSSPGSQDAVMKSETCRSINPKLRNKKEGTRTQFVYPGFWNQMNDVYPHQSSFNSEKIKTIIKTCTILDL